ncbi:DUF6290 family protein [Rhodococcus sp. 24CO]|uniref:DUF6290 family protein n=1 Tax=Rhodococcus sp. 24CO TaxID=3117460 RepID=UPI003D3266F2
MTERGRPKSEDPARNITSVRLTDSEHRLAKEAAGLANLRLGQYMRAKVVEAAQEEIGRAQQVREHSDGDETETGQ